MLIFLSNNDGNKGGYFIILSQKKDEDNREKIVLQEIEALQLTNSVDIDLLDKQNALESLREENLQGHMISHVLIG